MGMTDLKRVRDEQGLTLEQLSDLSGVSISTINRVEKGEVRPLLDTARALEKALGVSLLFVVEPDDVERCGDQRRNGDRRAPGACQ